MLSLLTIRIILLRLVGRIGKFRVSFKFLTRLLLEFKKAKDSKIGQDFVTVV